MTSDSDRGAARPIDAVRQQAAQTTPGAVRRELERLSAEHADHSRHPHWSAGAEQAYRTAIGMERKAQLEMRVGLGDSGAAFARTTAPLADLTLPELRAEYRENRLTTLALIDAVLARPDGLTWTLGEEVPPGVYIVSLRSRLERLGSGVAAERL